MRDISSGSENREAELEYRMKFKLNDIIKWPIFHFYDFLGKESDEDFEYDSPSIISIDEKYMSWEKADLITDIFT